MAEQSKGSFLMGTVKWLAAVLPAALLGLGLTVLVVRYWPALWARLTTKA